MTPCVTETTASQTNQVPPRFSDLANFGFVPV